MSDKIVLKDSTLLTSNEAKQQYFTLGSAGVFAFDAAKSFDNYLNANEIGLTQNKSVLLTKPLPTGLPVLPTRSVKSLWTH